MSSYWSPSLDRGFSSCTDFSEVDNDRIRRLAAKLFRVVRPVLGIEPRRDNAYIALDAVAWVAARILVGIEDRDGCDFFALALMQNLAQLEASETATDVDPTPVGSKCYGSSR
jgi:hypothetical protein